MTGPITPPEAQQFAAAWYRALDRHALLETVFTLNRKRAEALGRAISGGELAGDLRKLAGIRIQPGGAAPVAAVPVEEVSDEPRVARITVTPAVLQAAQQVIQQPRMKLISYRGSNGCRILIVFHKPS